MKKKNDTRDEILSFRVSATERSLIEEKALSSYRPVSMYLRDCAIGKHITVIPGADKVADELRRIGNNLNQLTRLANSGIITEANLEETKKEVAEVWRLLNSLRQGVR